MFIVLSLAFSNSWMCVSGAGFFLCCGLSCSLGRGDWCASFVLSGVCCFRGVTGKLLVSVGWGWFAIGTGRSCGIRGFIGVYILGVALFAWGLGGLARSVVVGCCSFLRKAGAVLASGGERLGSGGRFELAAWSCVGLFRGGVLVISAYVAGVVWGSF